MFQISFRNQLRYRLRLPLVGRYKQKCRDILVELFTSAVTCFPSKHSQKPLSRVEKTQEILLSIVTILPKGMNLLKLRLLNAVVTTLPPQRLGTAIAHAQSILESNSPPNI